MNIMQVSKMKQDLTPEQQQEFGAVMERFYASPPTDLKITGDYVTVDQSRSFTLMEVSSIERLSEINKPFAPYVEYEVFEIQPVSHQ